MRMFVAVELSDAVRRTAADVARQLAARLDPALRVRWVPFEQMHLTVRFIGHVDDAMEAAVLDALRTPLPIAPFEIALAGAGVFPGSGPPRVFWIGLSQGLPSLQQMHETFNRRLLPLGLEPEDRPFSAHLTLGRVKDAPGQAARTLRDTVGELRAPAAGCRIDHATVFQSRLSPRGSTYVPLLAVPCAG